MSQGMGGALGAVGKSDIPKFPSSIPWKCSSLENDPSKMGWGEKTAFEISLQCRERKRLIFMMSHQEQVLGEKAVQRGEVAPEEFLNPFFLPVRNPASRAVFKNEILCPNITSQL